VQFLSVWVGRMRGSEVGKLGCAKEHRESKGASTSKNSRTQENAGDVRLVKLVGPRPPGGKVCDW